MLIVDMTTVKLPDKVNQHNLDPECGQPIDVGGHNEAYFTTLILADAFTNLTGWIFFHETNCPMSYTKWGH
jgi:hypothetical protein